MFIYIKYLPSQDGRTALICAAEKGHADCVRLLVEGGADKEGHDKVVHSDVKLFIF